MQRTSGLIVVFLVILLASSYVSLVDSHGLAKKQQPAYRPGEVLIKYKQDTPPAVIEKRHTEWGVRTMRAFRHPRIKHLTLPPGMSVEDAIQLFSKDPGVEYVEPNYIWRRCATVPDDTRFSYLWGLNNTGQSVNGTAGTADADIDAPEAWDTTQGDATVIVAALDTGVDYHHPDLSDNVFSGYDFVDDDDDPIDPEGHGTHVAGIIAARGNNTTGISGVCWNIRILPVRVADATGVSTSARFIQGLDYAVTNGARIVNYSYGGYVFSQAAYDAISIANGDGVLIFAPAGNETTNNDAIPLYPASYNLPNIISVAASDQNDRLAFWSNYGVNSVDVAAPGVNILSTVPAPRTVIWNDNFDDGDMDGWTTGGTNNSFAVENYDGSNRLSDSPAANYSNDTDSWTRAPVLDLSSYRGVTLEFTVRGRLEENYGEYIPDYVSVETSTNGTDWTDQGSIWGDFSDQWYDVIVDLGAYDGQATVYFRFRLVTDESITYDGIYIDDMQVKAASLSYTGSEYAYYSGTSLATPFAAGIAALVWSAEPGLTHLEVKDRVLNGAERKNSLMGKLLTGARVNAYYAVTGETPPAPPPPPVPSTGGGGGGGCFIATAAFGSYTEPHVKILRDFRDRILMQNTPGRALVSFYYRVSPPVADFISRNERCKILLRWSLLPLVGASWVALKTGPVIALGWLVFLTILITRIAQSCYRRIHRRG